jgi:putative endopeptidase
MVNGTDIKGRLKGKSFYLASSNSSSMKPMKFISLFIAASFLLSFCNEPSKPVAGKDVFADNVDTTINPADDFFQFVNGKWFKNNPIPGSETNWGIGKMVNEEIYANLKKINEEAAKENAAKGTDSQKIGDFWATGMDSAKADKLGLSPLSKELKMISDCKDVKDIVQAMIVMQPLQCEFFYGGMYIGQDAKNSSVMAMQIWQGGLGLPDRDYYFNADSLTVSIRDGYKKHLVDMLGIIDGNAKGADADYQKRADAIIAFETGLASKSRTLEDQRDPFLNYNKMSIDAVTNGLTPSINWREMARTNGIDKIDSVIVGQPEFLSNLDKLLKATDINTLKDYMHFHLVSSYATFLSAEIDKENFNFYGKALSGAKSQRARWKRVLDSEEDAMGMVLGKLFVSEYFPAKTKERYNKMVEDIRTAYANRIKKLDWMSEPTKAKALDKLAKMTKKVGYPDKWKDYSKLEIGRNSYCENMMNASRWHFADMINKYGKPVDRTEWDMTPQTYNAYYNPSNNEIVLPAAIFTIPGFPDSLVDDAVVYGYAAASTIGHEITHGFDDEGRNYDAAGNLVSWWTSEDSAKFEARSFMMVRQFNDFEPLPGKHINGQASLGENIADYGGVLLGIDAFKLTEQYKKGEKIAGYTPMQRYFMGYALGWMTQQTEKELAKRLMTDVHAPAKWRVLGPFSNTPEFYEAFGVKEGNKMWRADSVRVNIW